MSSGNRTADRPATPGRALYFGLLGWAVPMLSDATIGPTLYQLVTGRRLEAAVWMMKLPVLLVGIPLIVILILGRKVRRARMLAAALVGVILGAFSNLAVAFFEHWL